MDQSKKNAVLFATIFSILTLVVVLFIVFKPFSRPAATGGQSATTTESTPVTPIEKKSIFSLFKFPTFSFLPNTNSGGGGMFPTGNPYQFVNTGGTTDTGQGSGSQPTNTVVLTPEEEQRQYEMQLESIATQLNAAQQDVSNIKFTLSMSPLYGMLNISSVYTSPSDEYIVLAAGVNLPKHTKITGMKFKSAWTGQTTNIGQGVYFPQTNMVNVNEDIYINPGDIIYVSSTKSPLGYSFRENKCTGYFTQFQNFSPGLTVRCPQIAGEPYPPPPNNLNNDACIDYVYAFPICRIHYSILNFDSSFDNSDPYYSITPECRAFVDNSSGYGNCIRLHQNDSDFWSPIWHIYLGRTMQAWKTRREVIQLLDLNDKIISTYSY